MQSAAGLPIVATLLAADLSDAAADRRVYLAAGGLVLLGVVMAVATAWWWHATRPDHPSLGPLEVMSRARFAALSEVERRGALDAARPRPAVADAEAVVTDPPVDLERSALVPLLPIDDLRDLDDTAGTMQRPSAALVDDAALPDAGDHLVDDAALPDR